MNYIQRFFGVAYVVVAVSSLSAMDEQFGVEQFDLEGTIATADSAVQVVAISADGRRLAAGMRSGTINVWDREPGKGLKEEPRYILSSHPYVSSLDFSPDGTQLASGGADERVRLWRVNGEAKNPPCHADLEHSAYVKSVKYSPNGQYVAAGACEQVSIHVWRSDISGEHGYPFFRLTGTAYGETDDMHFSLDGKYLLACSGCRVKVWPLPTTIDGNQGKLISSIGDAYGQPEEEACSLCVLPDNSYRVLTRAFQSSDIFLKRGVIEPEEWESHHGLPSSHYYESISGLDIDKTVLAPDASYFVTTFQNSRDIELVPVHANTKTRFMLKRAGATRAAVAISKDSKVLVTGGGRELTIHARRAPALASKPQE